MNTNQINANNEVTMNVNLATSIEELSHAISDDNTAKFEVERVSSAAKWSFITRNVDMDDVSHIAMIPDRTPIPGDLILANIDKVSQHTRIQLRSGRRSLLYPGDNIVIAFGNRYAPDQFEAVVPSKLEGCHLVASGGIAAKAISKHSSVKWPTSITPQGFCIGYDGKVLNLDQYALTDNPPAKKVNLTVAILGTSMNSGKTTTAAALVKGFTAAGYGVAAVKVTGTGAGNDLWAYADCGAQMILDFTDAGYPSTYKVSSPQILACFEKLISAADVNPSIDVTIVEVADGLLHSETTDLIASESFKNRVDHVLFAAGEAMGAVAGVDRLAALGIKPSALSGLMSASQLASSEAEAETGISVITKARLESPLIVGLLGK